MEKHSEATLALKAQQQACLQVLILYVCEKAEDPTSHTIKTLNNLDS